MLLQLKAQALFILALMKFGKSVLQINATQCEGV